MLFVGVLQPLAATVAATTAQAVDLPMDRQTAAMCFIVFLPCSAAGRGQIGTEPPPVRIGSAILGTGRYAAALRMRPSETPPQHAR
jgi:hypothetical protein